MLAFSTAARTMRMDKGLTLEKVAAKMGTHKGYISGIENRKVNPPSVKLVKKYAALFNKNEKELIVMSEIEKSPEALRHRHDLLEALRILVGDYAKIRSKETPPRPSSAPAEMEHQKELKAAWGHVEHMMAKLDLLFVPSFNGIGKGY